MSSTSKFFSIFNASVKNGQTQFDTQYSKFVHSILIILRREGFIFGFSIIQEPSSVSIKRLRIYIKYMDGRPVVKQLIQIYKPSRRVSASHLGLKLACSKFLSSHKIKIQTKTSVFIISSPFGLFTHYEAFRQKISGYLVCFVSV